MSACGVRGHGEEPAGAGRGVAGCAVDASAPASWVELVPGLVSPSRSPRDWAHQVPRFGEGGQGHPSLEGRRGKCIAQEMVSEAPGSAQNWAGFSCGSLRGQPRPSVRVYREGTQGQEACASLERD